jgi:hypothetical protein
METAPLLTGTNNMAQAQAGILVELGLSLDAALKASGVFSIPITPQSAESGESTDSIQLSLPKIDHSKARIPVLQYTAFSAKACLVKQPLLTVS